MAVIPDLRRRQMARIERRCKQMCLSRSDRLEIASIVLNANVESFNQLGPVEMARMVDGFDLAYYAMHLLAERQRGLRV